MTGDFIHPNYHVLLLHVPIGLLIVGFLGELIALVRPHHGLRAAARWMVVVGALMALPTALAGVYALRDVLVPGDRIALNMTWPQVAGAGGWPREQWHFMTHHAQYNVAAAVAVVLAAAGWLASGRPWRDRLPLPLLLVLAAGVVLLILIVTVVALNSGGSSGSAHDPNDNYRQQLNAVVKPPTVEVPPTIQNDAGTGGGFFSNVPDGRTSKDYERERQQKLNGGR